jgi:hypothetical protein
MVPRTFFHRFGTHGVCVLPSEVLSNDPLRVDPETCTMSPSLRKEAGVLGLCFARVLRSITDGLYWALVAATPDPVDAQRVLLTEEQLYHALPWDVRLVEREPDAIRLLMFAHAREVQPVQRLEPVEQTVTAPRAPNVLTPAPVLPLESVADAIVEVSPSELQEAFDPRFPDDRDDPASKGPFKRMSKKAGKLYRCVKPIGAFSMQQALLRIMVDTLMAQLYRAQDHLTAVLLQARCTLLAQIQRWHRVSRQRVVNAVAVWSEEHHSVLWQLTVGVPLAAYAAA